MLTCSGVCGGEYIHLIGVMDERFLYFIMVHGLWYVVW